MLWAYVTVTLILVSGRPVKSESVGNITQSIAEDFFRARCLKYGSADAFEELSNIDFFEGECYPMPHEVNNDEELFNMVCEEMPKQGRSCLENLMNKVEPCLAPEEKYLPSFFLESFNISVEDQCKDGLAHVKKLELQLSGAECALPTQEVLDIMSEKCLPQLRLYNNMVQDEAQSDFLLTEADLCGDLLKGKECMTGVLRKYCEDGVLAELLETVVHPFTTWCKKHKTEDNSRFIRLG